MRRSSRFFASIGIGIWLCGAANAEQVVVQYLEYSNDTITQGGQVVACVVTLVVTDPPDPRVLNFQFLQFNGRAGWKITGGVMDWKNMSAIAKRAADGSFTTSAFTHNNALQKNLTPEGQLVGILTQGDLYASFIQAFFKSPYSVSVRWENATDEIVYYVDKSPPSSVVKTFTDCASSLH